MYIIKLIHLLIKVGASAGREWFVDPSNKFKDQSIPEQDLELLDRVFDSISAMLEVLLPFIKY